MMSGACEIPFVKAHCTEYFLAFFFFLVRIQHLVFERERRKDADEKMLLFEVGRNPQLVSRT